MVFNENYLWWCIITNGFNDPNFQYMVHYDGSLTLSYFMMRVQQVFRIVVNPVDLWDCVRRSRYFELSADGLRYRINIRRN